MWTHGFGRSPLVQAVRSSESRPAGSEPCTSASRISANTQSSSRGAGTSTRPTRRARRRSTTVKRLGTTIAFYVGDGDSRFLAENRQLDDELTKAGISHIFRVYSGGHGQQLWSRYAAAWLDLALTHLAPAR
jgi:enterochelin esterase-like enzyme